MVAGGMAVALPQLSEQIWNRKYRFTTLDGQPVDKSIEDTWRRVAIALASGEAEPERWSERFYNVLQDFRFLPAGRILAGAGTERSVTLFNCFVMGTIEDDMGSIFAHLREAALTMQQGGGIGYDFSPLRPKGAPVRGVGADASGPLSFMDVWDSMCRTIMSAGARRGAMMGTLRCDHPDIEAFVDAKRDGSKLRMFNLSVLVTDAFMDAVRADASWPLRFDGRVFREIRARALWHRIMQATYESAEPGVIFIDRINEQNNLWYTETISSTNPCGEQPLPPYGACLLGSVNLTRLVSHPFTDGARLDEGALDAIVSVAVRMLDNAIDVSRFPVPRQAEEAAAKRRMGIGVTGLADALILCGVRYGTAEAIALVERWLAVVRTAAYRTSCALAVERGPFPLFDQDRFLVGRTIQSLEPELRAAIAANGIRNGLLTSIAPTGTISLLAGNVSSGIEPVFALDYDRTMVMADGTLRTEAVSDYAARLFRERVGKDVPFPDYFVEAGALMPADHVAMQAAAQKYIDSSISKTINCPESLSFEAFQDVYWQAYETGCKGCTTYRPSPARGAVLAVRGQAADRAGGRDEAVSAGPSGAPALTRPESLPGETYKIKWPTFDHAFYITVNDVIVDGQQRPFEVFINSKNVEHYPWTVALTLMISAVFRRGGDVSFVVDELKAVFDPRGGHWVKRRYVPSLLAAIGEVIEHHMRTIGFLTDDVGPSSFSGGTPIEPRLEPDPPVHCPKCGAPGMVRQEGCDMCPNCGHSQCV